ncbi:hypothetical protein IEO21_00816 [Rhodonia placenta]|uniref:Protein EFR3 n=1 Tax=Rhodonia placenta TaxID=104341 RepID=A0A8H7PAY7_9APHY|nr:hypothetical protein IEO21_00816 [Postia placenta]
MHLPFTPNHIHLISTCYPPSSALLTSGPEYLPNSQELSRLTYYASNRPGKINKLANELDKRVRADCRRAQAGNTRSRASLLITLYIFKSLAAECRRDISLLTSSLLSAITTTLTGLSSDLEVAARAATVFTTWTTYTDGHLIGVDQGVTQDYVSCLRQFSAMGGKKVNDTEITNRTRLVGLAALTAAVHSEALYHSSTHFNLQVTTIMPALLTSLFEERRASAIKEEPNLAFMDDFRTRPALERRAASIHLHVDGDRGPSSGDVVNASLHALSSILGHSTGNQVTIIMSAIFDFLNDSGGWEKVNHCRWLAAKASEWTQYQYRYAVPTRIVECLVEGQDVPQSTARHSTLAAMVTTVFTSPTPLVNLSTSDMISGLISLIFRRITVDPEDLLLPVLVECIASLGTHVYYADQIQDLAGELISRLLLVESNGIPGPSKPNAEKARSQAIRSLLAGLLGLMHAADMHQVVKDDGLPDDKEPLPTGTSAELPSESSPATQNVHIRPSRRTKIAPEVWQDTLVLLCDQDYAVRADYAVALVSYLQSEIPKLGEHVDVDGVNRMRSLAEGPSEQAKTMTAMVYGDSTTRFLNALHAYIYLLATSAALDLHAGSSTTDGNGSSVQEGNANHDSHGRRSTTVPPRSRKTSFILRAMQNAPKKLSQSDAPNATLSDCGNILAVLTVVHENLPIRGLLTGAPMLVALERAARADEASLAKLPLAVTIQHMVAQTWATIGRVWKCPDVVGVAEQATSSLPLQTALPVLPEAKPGTLHTPQIPVTLPSEMSDALPALDTNAMQQSLACSQNVRDTTGLEQEALIRRLTIHWTPELAFRDSVEANTNFDSLRRDGLSPLIKVAPALMHIDNISLQSLARSTRGVGVTDLRDALEGRSSISNPNLSNRAPSISTLDHTSFVTHPDSHNKLTPTKSRPQRSKLAGPGEVRDVLNKLGIGKQNGASQLKSSFPILQKPEQRAPVLTPPYKA